MFVDGSIAVVKLAFSRFQAAAARWALCILVAGAGALALAEAPAVTESEVAATTETYAWPTTGTLTAKQIGEGVWWQPELNETSVTQVLTDLQSWGVTNLYLDVFRSGHTLFPSEVFPQRADACGEDWMAFIIDEAHSRNIRVHAWAQVLCWHEPDDDMPTTHPLLTTNPAWLEVSVDGYAVDGKTAARYVSPAVGEVREALVALAHEICTYPVDGLNLDAVEYNSRIDSGYNAAAVTDFQEEQNEQPAELRVDMDNDSGWMKWVSYREDSLTSVVQLMAEQVRRSEVLSERRIMLSATVQPGYGDTRGINRRYQNWKPWLDLGLLDATIPECFNSELPELEQQLWEARSEHMGSHVACVPGLQVDSGEVNSHPPLKEQKRLLRNAGFQHCTVMDYEGLRAAMEQPDTAPEERGGFWGFLTRD